MYKRLAIDDDPGILDLVPQLSLCV